MYALLGDPATLLKMPEPLECKFEQRDGNWHWQVEKPKSATKLYVEIRPDGKSMPPVQLEIEKETARKNLELANDTFAFENVAELSSEKAAAGKTSNPLLGSY